MGLNCIVISEDRRTPAQIQMFLQNARFLEVKGIFADMDSALKMIRDTPLHYILIDLRSAENNLRDLFSYCNSEQRVVIFGPEEIYFLENIKQGLDTLFVSAQNSPAPRELPPSTEVDSPLRYIYVRSDSRIYRIDLEDLLYVEAQKDYVIFRTSQREYRVLNSMKNVAGQLDGEFFRLHRSYLVRMDKINSIDGDLAFVDGAERPLPIGPSFKGRLLERLYLI